MADGELRAADVLARRLYDAGCRHAFGMPGGEVLVLVDALERAGITFTLVRHENCGGFMAEGVHHRDGAPGILVATLGPGALNAVNVMANALQDRVPLVLLTGCIDADEAVTYTHQVVDHQAVFAPVTKASYRLTADSAGAIADKALGVACAARPGPVHIDVPISVASAPARTGPDRRSGFAPVVPAAGHELDRAREWLAEAKRPVLIAGLDALREGAGPAIRDFCETFGVPLITSYKAKGIVPEDHPLCLGGAGLSPKADALLLPFVREADLIICAGYDPIEMRTGWREVWDPEQVRVVDVSAEPNSHFMHRASLEIVADSGRTLALLGQGIEPSVTWAEGEVTALKSALSAAFPSDDDWGPAAVIDECYAVLPAETVATVDSGAHRILLSQMWTCREPRSLLQSSGFCTMGCAVPLAIGAKLADPGRPVVSFCGDAGMLMVAGELATAAELGLNPVFVVFVDSSLALIELKQRGMQLDNSGVDFGSVDFAAAARALGGEGHTVDSRAGLRAALSAALDNGKFSVIAAVIGRQSYDGRF